MSVLPDRVEWLEVFYMLEQAMSMDELKPQEERA